MSNKTEYGILNSENTYKDKTFIEKYPTKKIHYNRPNHTQVALLINPKQLYSIFRNS